MWLISHQAQRRRAARLAATAKNRELLSESVSTSGRRLAFRNRDRARLILGLLLLFILIGSLEKVRSAPDKEPTKEVFPPTVGVYAQDRSAQVSVEVHVFDQGDSTLPVEGATSWFQVLVKSSIATRILVLADAAPLASQSSGPVFTAITSNPDSPEYLAEFRILPKQFVSLGTFNLKAEAIVLNHKQLRAHLPIVTTEVLNYTEGTEDTTATEPRYIISGKAGGLTPRTVDELLDQPASTSDRFYYTPSVFEAKEVYLFIARYLAHATIRYDAPSTGSPGAEHYSWTGSSELAPYLVATSNDVVEGRADAAFVSAIFFGAAAAAMLALVQELSDGFRLRDSSRQSADGSDPGSDSSGIDAVKTAAILVRFRSGGNPG